MINHFVKILELLGDRLEVCVSVYVRDKMSRSIFNGQSMALKIASSNPMFTLNFVKKR